MNREYPNMVELFKIMSMDSEVILLDIIEEALSKMTDDQLTDLAIGTEMSQMAMLNVVRHCVKRSGRSDRTARLAAETLDNILHLAFEG